jgi:hypothetical protein
MMNAVARKRAAPMLIVCLVLALTAWATRTAAAQPQTYAAEELDSILAPIALYPDPLLAQVLPAATFADQIMDAAAKVKAQGPSVIASQNWDASVKAVAEYPEVLQKMAENEEWTRALGYAVVYQNQEVLEAVQRLRREAQAAGNLATTPEQKVVVEGQSIEILPAQPNVIYVPQYNPQVVYVDRGPTFGEAATVGLITFGTAYALSRWTYNSFNWHYHTWYRPPAYHPIPPYRPPIPPAYRPPYGPGYRPPAPPGARPPGTRPPPPTGRPPAARPPGTRPPPPGGRPGAPPTRPAVPSTRPAVPSTRPAVPPTRPAVPSTRPAVPSTRPAVPSTRPAVPSTRPAVPSTRPAVPSTRPAAPSTRPAMPAARPAPTPDRGRPTARRQPSGSGFGGYASQSQARQQFSRGQSSIAARPRPQARASAPRAARPSAPRGGGGRTGGGARGGGGRRR